MIQIFKLLRLALFLFALLGFNNLYGQQYNVTNAKGTILSLVNNQVFVSAVTPSDAFEADVWFNTSDRITYVYDGAIWKEIDEDRVTTSSTAPTDPVQGDVWFDSSAVLIITNIYDGSSWLLVSSSDDQLLSIDGDSLRLEDGGAVALDSLQDGDAWAVNGEDISGDIGRTGNVGIGTTSPSELFHVHSSQTILSPAVDSDVTSVPNNGTWTVIIADTSSLANITPVLLRFGSFAFVSPVSHDFSVSNTTSKGIVLSDPAIVVDNLRKSYWFYAVNGGYIKTLKVEFDLVGSELRVREQSARYRNGTSVPLANQIDAYFSGSGWTNGGYRLNLVRLSSQDVSAVSIPTLVATIDGDVGIGTSNPSENLHIVGNARITGAILDSNNDPGTSGQILSSTATGTDWVPSSVNTDDQLLSIDGDSLRLEDGGAVALDSLGSDDQLLSIDGDSLRLEDGGAVALDSLQDGDAWGVSGEDITSSISRDGNVGIGTSASAYSLDVAGDLRVQTLGNLVNNTPVASRVNGDVSFIGSTDYTIVDAIIYVTFTTGADITTTQTIYETGGSGVGTEFLITGGQFRVYAGNTSAIYNTASVLANTSYSAAVVYDLTNDEIRLYLRQEYDASLESSDLVSTFAFTQSLWAGSDFTGVGALNSSSRSGISGNFLSTGLAQIDLYTTNDITSISTVGSQSNTLVVSSSGNVGVGTAAHSEKLEVIGSIKATDINFTNLPIFNDEAAATTGGLASGDVYRTTTGEIRIKL